MTKEEAYIEELELADLRYRWDWRAKRTPYQHSVARREIELYNFWRFNAPAPEPRAEWERTRPPRDVEETVENWYRNNYRKTWREKMAEAGGKIPETEIKLPDFSRFAHEKPGAIWP
jgi:hypothetical protein